MNHTHLTATFNLKQNNLTVMVQVGKERRGRIVIHFIEAEYLLWSVCVKLVKDVPKLSIKNMNDEA